MRGRWVAANGVLGSSFSLVPKKSEENRRIGSRSGAVAQGRCGYRMERWLRVCETWLLRDVLPTLLILVLTGFLALLATQRIEQARLGIPAVSPVEQVVPQNKSLGVTEVTAGPAWSRRHCPGERFTSIKNRPM